MCAGITEEQLLKIEAAEQRQPDWSLKRGDCTPLHGHGSPCSHEAVATSSKLFKTLFSAVLLFSPLVDIISTGTLHFC